MAVLFRSWSYREPIIGHQGPKHAIDHPR